LGLTAFQKSEIERISLKRDMSQQKVMRMMIELGLELHRDMEKVGVVAAVDFAYYVKHALKAKLAENGRKQLNLI
jgi:predicted peroxiredoxin